MRRCVLAATDLLPSAAMVWHSSSWHRRKVQHRAIASKPKLVAHPKRFKRASSRAAQRSPSAGKRCGIRTATWQQEMQPEPPEPPGLPQLQQSPQLRVDEQRSSLWVMKSTMDCACQGCVPCKAKVLRGAGASTVPNARPESCRRFVSENVALKGHVQGRLTARSVPIGIYEPGQQILTVGDGDLSFSLALARALGGERLLASSYESREALHDIYPNFDKTLAQLLALGVQVAYSVDAADLQGTLPPGCLPRGGFDRVVWNFPCVVRGTDGAVLAGARAGADARGGRELEHNRLLLSRFFASAARLLTIRGGEVHLTHKVGLQQWKIEEQGGHESATSGLQFAGAVVFDRSVYPPYRPRQALFARSFPITDAQTFVFSNSPIHHAATLRPSNTSVRVLDIRGNDSQLESLRISI